MEMSNETDGAQPPGMSYSGLLPCYRSSTLLGYGFKGECICSHLAKPRGNLDLEPQTVPSSLCLCPSILLSSLPSELLGLGHLLSQVGSLYLVASSSSWHPSSPQFLGVSPIGMIWSITVPPVARSRVYPWSLGVRGIQLK